jgi:hypothetical protein
VTTFGTTVEYTCGTGRKLMTNDADGNTVYYDKYSTYCQWNQTYAKNPSMVRI